MLINRIRLENFKNFENLDISLNRMNVIVGANACGKSNFIQAIRFLRDIQNFGIENAISLQGGIEYLQNLELKGSKNTVISIDLQIKENSFTERVTESTRIKIDYDSINYIIEIACRKKQEIKIVREELVISTKKIEEIDDFLREKYALPNQTLFLRKRNGNIVRTINNKIESKDGQSYTIRLHYVEPFDRLDDDKETFIEKIPWRFRLSALEIYDFDLKNAKRPASITAKADLEENGENLALVLRNILQDKEQARQFSNLITDILPFIKELDTEKSFDKSLLFKVKEKYNSKSFIPSSLLSDGTISVVAIVIALFFEDNELAIFEEPERGIHPSLIAKLMQLFYDTSKQIILTTHNPEIVKHTQLNDLFLMYRSESGFATVSKPAEKEMVKSFLENELGIDQLYIQNLLEV